MPDETPAFHDFRADVIAAQTEPPAGVTFENWRDAHDAAVVLDLAGYGDYTLLGSDAARGRPATRTRWTSPRGEVVSVPVDLAGVIRLDLRRRCDWCGEYTLPDGSCPNSECEGFDHAEH